MSKLVAITFAICCTSLSVFAENNAKPENGSVGALVETKVVVTQFGKDGSVIGTKEVNKSQVIGLDETLEKEKIIDTAKTAKRNLARAKSKESHSDGEVSLGFFNEATDFVKAAKGGVGNLVGSIASTAGGLVSGTVESALAAIF